MRRMLMSMVALAGLSGLAAVKSAPAPKPVVTPDEQAVSFWVKFDKLPSVGEPTGLLGCKADAEGRLLVTWKALPTEIVGDLAMTAMDTVKAGEWHHVEANFSMMQQRATFYLDGKFQWENDNLNVPHLKGGLTAEPSADFKGKVWGLRRWNEAADSEKISVAFKAEAERRVKAAAADLAAAEKAGARSKGLATWIAALKARGTGFLAANAKGELPVVTLAELKALQRDAAHAKRIATDAAAGKRGLADGAATFVVPPLTQDPILPYDIPYFGVLSDEMRIFACPDEYENASFVMMALEPLNVKRIEVTPLKGKAGVIPPFAVDLKLVKRWYRSGSAWIAYHNDRRLRVLCPDLLVNDDSLIYVDEQQMRNYLRLDYPEGSIYSDVSDVGKNHFGWNSNIPFKDAKVIQPFAVREAGRNQQVMATVHVPKDAKAGLYEGALNFLTDRGTVSVKLAVKVLPIELPVQPSPYRDTTRSYISHMNSFPAVEGATYAERLEYVKFFMRDIHAHNMNHTTGVWDWPSYAKLAFEEGFVPDRLFMGRNGNPGFWWDFYPGVARKDLTAKDREMALKACERKVWSTQEFLKKTFPEWSKHYVISFSEATDFNSLSRSQGEVADAAHAIGKKTFAHGMGHWNSQWAGDIQDMNSSTLISAEEASRWHAAGGEMINYADPFPSAESPYWYRRKQGVLMYRTGLDGHMMHGYRQGRTPWNEWGEDWGGDGNYRNFCNCYPMQGGALMKLCWEGTREGYDDIRYLTRLTQLAQANLDSKDPDLLREAKRAMLWIEKTDGLATDLDALRAGTAERIILLQDQIKKHGGTLPPAEAKSKK